MRTRESRGRGSGGEIRLQDAVIHGTYSLQVLKEDDTVFIVPRSDELQRQCGEFQPAVRAYRLRISAPYVAVNIRMRGQVNSLHITSVTRVSNFGRLQNTCPISKETHMDESSQMKREKKKSYYFYMFFQSVDDLKEVLE